MPAEFPRLLGCLLQQGSALFESMEGLQGQTVEHARLQGHDVHGTKVGSLEQCECLLRVVFRPRVLGMAQRRASVGTCRGGGLRLHEGRQHRHRRSDGGGGECPSGVERIDRAQRIRHEPRVRVICARQSLDTFGVLGLDGRQHLGCCGSNGIPHRVVGVALERTRE